MLLVVALSVLIGLSLGLLGGGGSMLSVPLLTYAAGMDAKHAIATSLLVVAVTSLAAVIPHARRGLVAFRQGTAFGLAGMAGAFGGTRVAAFIPNGVLLVAFALIMFAAGVSMLRRCAATDAPSRAPQPSLVKSIVHGALVGSVTGMLGAGGGFLIVPSLVLLGAVPMPQAVATSLWVIAMNSLAGFAGYAGHIALDWTTAGLVTAAAVCGSLVGASFAGRFRPRTLRRAFGWLAIGMALFVLVRELSAAAHASAAYAALFVTRWPWWAAGSAIAAVVLALLFLENKQLGVSTGCSELCAMPRDAALRKSWRPRFLLGIVLGGGLASLLAGRTPTWSMGGLDQITSGHIGMKLALLLVSGVLIGFGARKAGGCTSGHGIVGTALFARSSWLATMLFMLAGFITTHALHWLRGG